MSDQGRTLIPLSNHALPLLFDRHQITVPGYMKAGERSLIKPGVVVMGTSNLARSLICDFMESACEEHNYRWGVSVVSTRNPDVVDALNEQDLLYASVQVSPSGESAVLNGVICEALFAKTQHSEVMHRLGSEETSVVFLTITEAGYYLQPDVTKSEADFDRRLPMQWLDTANEEVARDLLSPDEPSTVIGYLVAALKWRRYHSIEPFTIVSCDNMPRSGRVTKMVVLAYAEQVDADLAKWIDQNVDFCDSVVDRITPAERLEASQQWLSEQGVKALRPVTCEPYKRLIISDNWRNGIPSGWRDAGIEFMARKDLDAWRQVKQRLLNGSHVNLAIAGNFLGHEFVHEAIEDETLQALIVGFMREAERTLVLPPNFDAEVFIDETIERFDNSALPDPLQRVGRFRCRKVNEHVLQTASLQLQNGGEVGEYMLKLTTLWVYSMITPTHHLFTGFPEKELHGVHEMCQSIWDAAVAGNESLVATALQSRTTFPAELSSNTGFTDKLTEFMARLNHLVRENGTEGGVREFIVT